MAGRSSAEREALARQNAAIMAVFERAGFDHIAPDIIQPADIFLERSGEDIRARTFVFSDPDGNELCLRPDLTVLVVSAETTRAVHWLLPAGPFREGWEALERADAVFALLDGLDPGTLFEVGYARSRGKPVVGLAEAVPRSALTMYEGTGCFLTPDFTTAVYRAGWEARRK